MTAREATILANLVRHLKAEDDPLTPLVDTYLSKRISAPRRLATWTVPIPERPRPGGRLSPSSIGGCARQAALRFIGYQPPRRIVDPDRELIFEDGNWRHFKWNAMFADMEIVLGSEMFRVIEYEKAVKRPNLYIAGSLDTTIWIAGSGKIIVDYKGANDYAFSRIYREHAPPEEYVRQLTTYMALRKVRKGMLLFDNKNNQQFKVFVLEFDDEVWSEIEDWCQRVIWQMENRELPRRHPNCNNGSFLMERCPFSQLCFGKHRDDPDRMRRIAYKNFSGVDEAWQQGLKDAL